VIALQACDGHVVQCKPVMDDLLEVVRGMGLYHNLQVMHGSSPLSGRWHIEACVGVSVVRASRFVNKKMNHSGVVRKAT